MGVAGVWAAAAPLGVPSGKTGHHPGSEPWRGSAAAVSRAGSMPLLGSPDRRRHASALLAGFSPARGVINVPPPAPARVCVCGLVSGVLWHKSLCDAWWTLGYTRSCGGITGPHSESPWVAQGRIPNGTSGRLGGSFGCLGGSSGRLGQVFSLRLRYRACAPLARSSGAVSRHRPRP